MDVRLGDGAPHPAKTAIRYAPLSVAIDPDRLFRRHCTLVALLVAAHLVVTGIYVSTGRDRLLGLSKLFRLTAEANLPSFFSALALAAAALAAALLAKADAGRRRA